MFLEFYPDLVNSLNAYGSNGLHIAAGSNNVEVFEYLVKYLGIDVNSTDGDGDGVLYYAEKDEAIEKLKELGAEE